MPTEVFEEILEIVSYMTFFSPTISLDMWGLWPLMMEALADWSIDFFPSMVLNYILTKIHLNFYCSTKVKYIGLEMRQCLPINLKTQP